MIKKHKKSNKGFISINKNMATLTLSLPDEFKNIVDKHPEIKWSEVFRNLILSKIEQLKKLEELESGGKL